MAGSMTKADDVPTGETPAPDPIDPKAAAQTVAAKVKADKVPRGAGRPSNKQRREDAVTEALVSVGSLVGLFEPFDGLTLAAGAPDVGTALAELAEKNPRVAKALDSMTVGSSWGGVAIALGAIIIPIAAHHRMLPGSMESHGAGKLALEHDPSLSKASPFDFPNIPGMPDFAEMMNDPEVAAMAEKIQANLMNQTVPPTS